MPEKFKMCELMKSEHVSDIFSLSLVCFRDLRLTPFPRFSRGPDADGSPVLTGVGKLLFTHRRISL